MTWLDDIDEVRARTTPRHQVFTLQHDERDD